MGYKIREVNDEFGKEAVEIIDIKHFDKVMAIEELIEWEEKRRERIEKDEEKYKKIKAEREKWITEIKTKEYEEESKLVEEQREQQEEERKKQQEEEKIRKKAYEEERERWISEFGSQYLKDALKLKYDINKTYVYERAKKEFPGYALDYFKNAGCGTRDNPSKMALDEVMKLVEEGYDACIVWLTDPPELIEDDYEFEEVEAIVIQNYLGEYDLIKAL